MTIATHDSSRIPSPLQVVLTAQLGRLENDPNDIDAWKKAAATMAEMGHVTDAVEAQRRAVALLPADANVAVDLGRLLSLQGARDEPEKWYRHALKLDPFHLDARIRLGSARLHAADLDEAGDCFAEVLRLDPSDQSGIAGVALVLDRKGNSAEAWRLLQGTKHAGRPCTRLAMAFATVGKHVGHADIAVDVVRKAVRRAPQADRPLLLHAQGDLQDALGNHTWAWRSWTQANEARRLRFDATRHSQAIDSLIEVSSQLPAPNGPHDERPVFVVGMPRTGTTLLESMLDAHPDVAGVGELETVRDLAVAIPRWAGRGQSYLELIDDIATWTPRVGKAYLDHIDRLAPGAQRVVDKMPNNALHLGLIGMALPKARIIWCERDSDDVALSCFQQSFGAGLPWATSLQGIRAWQRGLERLRVHWESVLDQPILRLRYEDMVSEPEVQARRVAEYLDIEFVPEMLDFHTRRRNVKTASWDQVDKALHRGRVGRSAPYLPWLQDA